MSYVHNLSNRFPVTSGQLHHDAEGRDASGLASLHVQWRQLAIQLVGDAVFYFKSQRANL